MSAASSNQPPQDDHGHVQVPLVLRNATVSRPDVFVAWCRITPSIAKYLLDRHNAKNRPVRPRVVALYAGDMANGRWIESGEPLIFCWDGHGGSEQHRLAACIESNSPFTALVVWGVDPHSRSTVDSGSGKTLADRLTPFGVKNASVVSSAVGFKIRYDLGVLHQSGAGPQMFGITHRTLEQCLADNRGLLDTSGVQVREPGLGSRGLWCWLLYEFQRIAPDMATAFFNEVVQGLNVQQGSNAHYLRLRLKNSGANSPGGRARVRIPSNVVAAFIVKAWNAERSGEVMKTFKWLDSERFPVII